MSGIDTAKEKGPERTGDDDARPLTGEAAAAMRLRPEPPRVTRLSRKVLAGLGLVAGLGIGGALIYALQARKDHGPGQELYATDIKATPDGLAGLPKDYTGIPKLGRPLPGDLGRAILNAQTAAQPPISTLGGMPNPALSPEEQRQQQESEAARTGRLFAQTNTRPANPVMAQQVGAASVTAAAPVPDLASLGLAPPPATPTAQERQLAFLNQAVDRRTVSPDRVAAPASANILQAGAVIPAALITGIRSDLPGQITAQVTENVHDSPTGRILLIPQGTRIIG